MKKKVMIFFALIVGTIASAQNLRESIAIVRPNFSENTQTFLTDFSKSLRKDGFYAAADILQNYGKGSFGTGFAYRDKRNGRLYIITNRHVVEQAETVDVEFSLPDNSSKTFATCPVVGVHDDFDVAFIALPEEANIPTLDITDKSITDGTPVFSAGFPALGNKPSWQLGQGIVSNASAQIKSLTNGKELPLVQHTAQVDAGSSGGPLLIRDENAAAGFAVVGINTWKASDRENTNFAIPVYAIDDFLKNYSTDTQSLLTRTEVSNRASAMLKAAQSSYQAVMPFVSYRYVGQHVLRFGQCSLRCCHRCHEIVLRARATVGGYPYRIVRYYLSPVLREKLYFFDRGRSRFHQQDRRGHIYHRQQKHLYPMDHGARTLAVERCGKYQSQSNRA